jgi:hypothetical protein
MNCKVRKGDLDGSRHLANNENASVCWERMQHPPQIQLKLKPASSQTMNSHIAAAGSKRSRRVSNFESNFESERHVLEEGTILMKDDDRDPKRIKSDAAPLKEEEILTRRVSELSTLGFSVDEETSESPCEEEIRPSTHVITPSSSLIFPVSSPDTLEEEEKKEPQVGLSIDEEVSVVACDEMTALTKPKNNATAHCSWKFVMEMLLIQVVVWLVATLHYQTSNQLPLPMRNQTHDPHDCIYVPGGGFSGFWFSLGRLQSLSAQELQQETFVCYSAGCLGVVATLLQHLRSEIKVVHGRNEPSSESPVGHQHLYTMARSIQVDWLEGRIHRYQVVEHFIDGILDSLTEIQQDPDPAVQATYDRFFDILQHNLHITTTVPTDKSHDHRPLGASLQAALRSPTDQVSLKHMLLQTTWIPMAVGSSFTHDGHLDGAFSTFQHPTCRRHVGLVVPKKENGTYMQLLQGTVKLFSNTLNVNLGKQAVEDLWQMGLDYGV